MNRALSGIACCLALSACAAPVAGPPPDPAMVAALDRAAPSGCNPYLAQALTAHGVAPAQIRGLVYQTDRQDSGGVRKVTAWVELQNQGGYVVGNLSVTCYVEQIYTVGGASVPRPG